MNRHSIRVLEFEKVRSTVCDYCLTDEAARELHRERIGVEPEQIDRILRQAVGIRRCLQTATGFPSLTFPPLRDHVERLSKEGVVLETTSLADIAVFARSASQLRSFLETSSKEADESGVDELAEAVPDMSALSSKLFRYLEPDGTVRERDIPELKVIRSRISKAQADLQREARSLLSRDDLRRAWNAEVPTVREGRTVLPLKADHRGKVTGIVHEVSSTGATIFIEPDGLVERNNAVTEEQNRYQIELMRILRELSAECRANRDDLILLVDAVAAIDRVYARARYAIQNDCTPAGRSNERIVLRQARHPLLGEGAVPISIEVPPGKRVVVITGPNTGGKTVSLKTIGLLALMNQFGMEVPAGPGTELPVFTGVYADIGDEQSIEQSLSTFSGHMRNIGRVLAAVDDRSLVLLDELGSGTDPEEGGALAMAILDELLERRAYTVVTTHHGALKHYGFTHKAAANASVEFDMKSLRPTYRIVPGVPGSSHAIDVAAHMGLLRTVTRAAREYLKGDEYDTGRIIRSLTDREQELHRERESLQSGKVDIESRQRELEAERERLDRREAELRKGRLRDLEEWGARARSELENLVREIREGELTREKTRKVKAFAERTARDLEDHRRAEVSTEDEKGPADGDRPRATDQELLPGRDVRVRSSGKHGTLVRPGKGGKWQVQFGAVKLDVPASDLEVVDRPHESQRTSAASTIAARPRLELDLRGYRLDDALEEVERQLDQALLSGMSRFGIIHGTGEGVLQKGVRDYLRRNEHVASFEFARPEDGGFGKTVVNLR